jgi:acetone carboxylase gamma subunit
MKIYYCECGGRTEVPQKKIVQCECGKVFGSMSKISDNINMRKTWSGTTKVEFSQTTMDEDIKQRNAR